MNEGGVKGLTFWLVHVWLTFWEMAMVQFAFLVMVIEAQLWIYRFSIYAVDSMWIDSDGDKVVCHKLCFIPQNCEKYTKFD